MALAASLDLPSISATATPPTASADASGRQAQALLRALADPIRLQVVEALRGGERCVCELTAALELAQSRLSFHLKVMKQAGLIHSRQEGRWIYYRLDPAALRFLHEWLAALACDCEQPASPCD
jgi:ArsR family transcriptional regulator